MTTLDEKAEQANDVELRRVSKSTGVYRIEALELESANEVTEPGEYPEHGDWLPVVRSTGAEEFLECPRNLARDLVDLDVEVGDAVEIGGHRKVDGEWQFGVRILDENQLEDGAFEQNGSADDWTEDLW